MKVIHYGTDELVTGDRIADALVRYAQFLAVARLAATVDIPVIGSDGEVITASVLLGPASQIVALTKDTELKEIVDEVLVSDLMAKADKIGPAKAYPSASHEEGAAARFADDL